jgi:hypothetical protein
MVRGDPAPDDRLCFMKRNVSRMRSLHLIVILLFIFHNLIVVVLPGQAADRDGGKVKSPYNIETIKKGTSSRSSLREAKQILPLNRLAPGQRRRADDILKSVSLFRQLPQLRFEVEPQLYQYFMVHPDAAVSIWRVMDISQFEMTETSPRIFEADAGDGSKGVTDILFQSPHECVLICNGIYTNPLLLRPIKANGLVHLTTAYTVGRNRRPVVVHRANVFISFPSTTIKTAARVISPLTNTIMDRNFYEVSVFLQMMSMAMERQPGWVEHIVSEMDGVDVSRKPELLNLTRRIRSGAVRRNVSTSMINPVSVEQLTEPLRVTPLSRSVAVNSTEDSAAGSEEKRHAAPDLTGRVRVSNIASGTSSASSRIPVRTVLHRRESALPVIIPRAVADSLKHEDESSAETP